MSSWKLHSGGGHGQWIHYACVIEPLLVLNAEENNKAEKGDWSREDPQGNWTFRQGGLGKPHQEPTVKIWRRRGVSWDAWGWGEGCPGMREDWPDGQGLQLTDLCWHIREQPGGVWLRRRERETQRGTERQAMWSIVGRGSTLTFPLIWNLIGGSWAGELDPT